MFDSNKYYFLNLPFHLFWSLINNFAQVALVIQGLTFRTTNVKIIFRLHDVAVQISPTIILYYNNLPIVFIVNLFSS